MDRTNNRVKAKWSLCKSAVLSSNIAGMEVKLHAFLKTAVDGGEHCASRSGRSVPDVRGWVGLRATVGIKRERPALARSRTPRCYPRMRNLTGLFTQYSWGKGEVGPALRREGI